MDRIRMSFLGVWMVFLWAVPAVAGAASVRPAAVTAASAVAIRPNILRQRIMGPPG